MDTEGKKGLKLGNKRSTYTTFLIEEMWGTVCKSFSQSVRKVDTVHTFKYICIKKKYFVKPISISYI